MPSTFPLITLKIPPWFLGLARKATLTCGGLLLATAAAWAFGALWFDFPFPRLRQVVAVLFAMGIIASLLLVRPRWRKISVVSGLVLFVAGWWMTLTARNDRDWMPDVAETPWAEVEGDLITLHNVRNCDYRSETDYTVHWTTRTVRLSRLTGVDVAITFWGSPWMAHPIISFQFADAPPLAFSIETRKESGESYSAIGGLYRQFELIYVAAEERDVVALRTNQRIGEDVYLYRTTLTASAARGRFMEYIQSINQLHQKARWYNALTSNCTTAIRTQHPVTDRMPWDWRLLANGKMDELFYDLGVINTGGLPFEELKQRARINEAARAAGPSEDFPVRIREGRPGFPSPAPLSNDAPSPKEQGPTASGAGSSKPPLENIP